MARNAERKAADKPAWTVCLILARIEEGRTHKEEDVSVRAPHSTSLELSVTLAIAL